MPRYTSVAQTSVARGPGTTACRCQQMQLKYVITPQRTGLSESGATCSTQTHKQKSTELGVGKQLIKHSRPIHGYRCVMIGCNSRRFPDVLGSVDTKSRLQNPHWQCAPVRDALTMLPPMSLPQMSGKTSETGGKQKQDAQTFENDSIWGAPNVAKRPRDLVGHNIYMFRVISENVEFVGMPKILSRVDFNAIPICLQRCRAFRIKMGILPESQTLLLVFETAEVPQNLLKAWAVTENLWHRNQISGATSIALNLRFTTIGWAAVRELRR